MGIMKIKTLAYICTFILMTLIYTTGYAAHELDISALGAISGGNKDTVDVGANLKLKLGNLDGKVAADYQDVEDKIYEQYLADIHYEYEIDRLWSSFAQARAEHNSIQKIEFKSLMIVGAIYKITAKLKYSLGIGHRLENGDNSLIASHRAKYGAVYGNIEPVASIWVHHGYDDVEIESELGIRVRPYKTFRFGIIGVYSYDSDPIAEVKPVDYSAKAELTFNLYGASE